MGSLILYAVPSYAGEVEDEPVSHDLQNSNPVGGEAEAEAEAELGEPAVLDLDLNNFDIDFEFEDCEGLHLDLDSIDPFMTANSEM